MGQWFSGTPSDKSQEDLPSKFDEYFKNFEVEDKIIPRETIRLIELHLKRGNMLEVNNIISDALQNIDKASLDIAVTGDTGAGKSSFINALRGVAHDSEEAAAIGVQETTMERTPYKHPNLPTVTIWDLPGIGSTNFQPKDYLEKVKFKEYDFFIIISATRFRKNELDLARAIGIMKKKFFFLRTKVDLDLRNEEKCKPRTFERERVLQQIRNDCVSIFEKNEMENPQIFLIDNTELREYDFPVLMDTLIKELPVQKRHIFMLALPNITEAAIERKRESMKQSILMRAMKGGLRASVPLVGTKKDKDVEKLQESLDHYQDLFGVDDASLEALAENLQVPVQRLRGKLQSPYLLETKGEEIRGKYQKHLEKFVPLNGGLLPAGLYFGKIYYLQLHFLNTVAEDAKVLLTESCSRK